MPNKSATQRVIKFRAWDKEKKEMFSPSSVSWKDGVLWVCGAHGENKLEYELINPDARLMQFTGLLDKKGKEIFEGDIVKEVNSELDPKPEKALKQITVEIPHIYFERWVSVEGEIIGNIYENPDLIKNL